MFLMGICILLETFQKGHPPQRLHASLKPVKPTAKHRARQAAKPNHLPRLVQTFFFLVWRFCAGSIAPKRFDHSHNKRSWNTEVSHLGA